MLRVIMLNRPFQCSNRPLVAPSGPNSPYSIGLVHVGRLLLPSL